MRVVRLVDRYGVVDVMCAAPARLVTGWALAAVQADAWLREAGADVGGTPPTVLRGLRKAA